MKEGTKDETIQQEEHAKEHQKQPYTTPQLSAYGTVEKLTQALGSGMKDGLTGSLLL